MHMILEICFIITSSLSTTGNLYSLIYKYCFLETLFLRILLLLYTILTFIFLKVVVMDLTSLLMYYVNVVHILVLLCLVIFYEMF